MLFYIKFSREFVFLQERAPASTVVCRHHGLWDWSVARLMVLGLIGRSSCLSSCSSLVFGYLLMGLDRRSPVIGDTLDRQLAFLSIKWMY